MLFLIFFIILAILLGYSKSKNKFNINNVDTKIISFYILMPLVEELIFRDYLRKYTDDLYYGNLINSCLFGLWHLQNYHIHEDKIIMLNQIISTTYLGYYLLQLNSIIYSYIVHLIYNTIIIGGLIAMTLNNPDKSNDQNEFKKVRCFGKTRDDSFKSNLKDINNIKYVKVNNKVKCSIDQYSEKCKSRKYISYTPKSLTDDLSTNTDKRKFISINNMNKEIVKSINKFNKITQNRNMLQVIQAIPEY